MPLLPIKLSKRKGMPAMGLRDSGMSPSSGASSASGITMDYSAIGFDNGVPWNHADDVNDKLKSEEKQRMNKYQKHNSLSQKELANIHLIRLKQINGFDVWVVDGGKIRNKIDIDFTTGGNPGRYKYIPENEIWIDNSVKPNELKDVILHELTECGLMENKGKSYDTAHDMANEKEMKLREVIEVNETDDPYNDNNSARGEYVGSKEEGFSFRHNLDYGATANLAANIIKGNEKHVKNNPNADKFYNEITAYLKSKGYKVSVYAAEITDVLPKADLWIGHSKGLNKLNACAEKNTKLLAVGALPEKSNNAGIIFVNHAKDEEYMRDCLKSCKYDKPIDEHYIFTDTMKSAIDRITNELIKHSYPDYPAYQPNYYYEEARNSRDYFPTPTFDIFNTYYADDVPRFNKRHWFDWEYNKGAMNMDNTMWYEIRNDLLPLWNSNTDEKEVEEWIASLQVRMGIPPKNFAAIKRLVDDFRKTDYINLTNRDEVITASADLLLYLREYARTDPEWIKHNTYYTDEEIEALENDDDTVEVKDDEKTIKQAFVKTAITYDSNSVIQSLIKIPEIKALIEQQASGFVDSIIVSTPSADIQQTQQRLNTQSPGQTLEPISGNPYGHMFMSKDPTTHQKKPLDKIVRIDRITDQWGTLNTLFHEICHHRHPDWSESQVEAEALRNADSVKRFLEPKNARTKMLFVKRNLRSLPVVECDVANTYQKQVVGLQSYSSLRPDTGLLFTYSMAQPLTYHMGTVIFPIDIVFADQNKIMKIYHNCQPNSMDLYSCAYASRVIEVVGNFCAFHDIEEGDHIFYADDKEESFVKHTLEKIREIKLEQQKDLDMTNWNIRVVMKKEPDSRRFIKVNWSAEDYALKKADLIINPDPILMRGALKEMSLEKLVRHALLHILAGYKHELPEAKEQKLITNRLFKEACIEALKQRSINNE
jgi:uncharacterized membrane protein (UPF0127 family)